MDKENLLINVVIDDGVLYSVLVYIMNQVGEIGDDIVNNIEDESVEKNYLAYRGQTNNEDVEEINLNTSYCIEVNEAEALFYIISPEEI